MGKRYASREQRLWFVGISTDRVRPIVAGREFQDGIEVKHGLSGGEMVVAVPVAPQNLIRERSLRPRRVLRR